MKRPTANGTAATVPNDEFLAPTGRVMEMLSEHQCEGWLEGYLLTGRHRLFNCYEAFIHIIVRGYKEEGTITTPFDMTVLNDLDRFHLVMDPIDRLPRTGDKGVYLKQQAQGQAHRAQAVHRQIRSRHAGNPELEVEQPGMSA